MTRFIGPSRKPFVLGSLAKLCEAMLELYLPILMALIIDVGVPAEDRALILRTGAKILLYALVGLICAGTCQYCAAEVSQATGTRIRDAVMEKIAAFSYRELDRFGVSTLMSRLTTDVNHVQQAVAMTMRLVTRAPFICIGAVVMSVRVDASLSLVFAVMIPLLGLLMWLLLRLTAPLYRVVQSRLDTFALVVRENLTGVRVIRAFARTGEERRRADEAAEALSDGYIRVAGISALLNPTTSILVNLGIIVLLYLGAGRVCGGRLSRGDLLALSTYATKILYALLVIANLVVLFTKASASAARLQEVLSCEPSVSDRADIAPQPIAGAPAIEFDQVSFAYHGDEKAIADLSFQLQPGGVLGIVGGTGSGKSTVAALLQRFYDPDAGQVRLSGVPLWDYPTAALRELIGIAPQRGELFSGSIADNLRYGAPEASAEELIAALHTAQAWEFVSALPEGIDSPVVEGGKNFSGGQRQRLVIARALAGRPPLVILDDSLSALDYRTDLNLRRALATDLGGSTVVIISQRISSVLGADHILVLEDGRRAGFGSHLQLLDCCPVYREIYETQSERPPEGGNSHA